MSNIILVSHEPSELATFEPSELTHALVKYQPSELVLTRVAQPTVWHGFYINFDAGRTEPDTWTPSWKFYALAVAACLCRPMRRP